MRRCERPKLPQAEDRRNVVSMHDEASLLHRRKAPRQT